MKRKSMVRIGAAALLCFAMAFSSCDSSGAGADGKDGEKGLDGLSLIWKGSLTAAPSEPAVNWAYHNSADGNSYIWDGDSWEILAAAGVPGAPGEPGEDGAPGTGVVWKGSLAAAPETPELNWAYYNTVDGSCYIYNGSAWEAMVVGPIPAAVTYNTTLAFDKAEDMPSGFAALVAAYNPNDRINVTVTLNAGFDFSELADNAIAKTVGGFDISGLDPVNGLFTAIGSDNVYVHYNFAASGWTGVDSGGDPLPFYLETTGGDVYSAANLDAVRPHRNQILSITMPAALKGVGDYLFYDLQGLQKVSFAGCSALETINSYAFAAAAATATSLTDISFTGCTKLSYIGDYAFLYSSNLRGSDGTTTLDLSAIDVPLLTIRDYAFFRAGANGAMKSVTLPGGGWFGNNAFVRNNGVESVRITDGRWSELTWNNFLYLDKPAGYDPYGYSSLPPLWVRETANGDRGLGTGLVVNFFVPDSITLQRMAKGSDLLTNSEDDGNYFAGQLIPTNNGADAYRGQSSMALTGTVSDTITKGGEPVSTLASSWTVYSQPIAESRYAIGTMVKGVITLSAPAVSTLETLTPEAGMKITGDPRDYYLSAADAVAKTGSKGQHDLPGDMWMVGAGPYASNTGYFWQPAIANNSGAPVTNAKAITVKDFYYPGTINQHTRYTWTVQKIGPGDAPQFDTDGDGTADAFKDDVMWSDWGGYGSDTVLDQEKFTMDDNAPDVKKGTVYGELTLEELFAMDATMWGDIRWYSPDVEAWAPKNSNEGASEPYSDAFGYVKTKNGSEISFLENIDSGAPQTTFTKVEIVDADKNLIACNAAAVAAGKSDNPQIYLSGEYYYFKCHVVRDAVTIIDSVADWKKASRTGVDTYCIINHVTDNKYYTDQRKVYYVYVSQDVNLLRTAKSGNEIVLDHDKELGAVQTYYEEIPAPVKALYNLGTGPAAWTVNHHSVHLALKAGWNQVEEKTTYPGEISAAAEYRGIKTHRVSAAKQGPFSTFDSGNTSDFMATSGKAYMLVDADGTAGTTDDIVKQYYSDAGHEIPVPWVSTTAP